MMQWLDMGGYGAYVYASYGLALIVLAVNILWPYVRLRQLRRTLGREQAE